jgi:formate hydrogenlyase subunit 3/multisubunit Na+/H+ antiporter MnhD subunit
MTLLLGSLLLFAAGALLALLTSGRPRLASHLGCAGTVAGGLLGMLAALTELTVGGSPSWAHAWAVPGGRLALHLDPLAAFFLLPACLLALLCAVYAVGYLHDYPRPGALGPHWFFFNLLVAGIILVLTAANAVLFLAAWEIMTVASFFLVAFEHRQPEVRKAAWLYLVLAHLALMLLLAFFVTAGVRCDSFDFADFGPLAQLSPAIATLLFALAAAGFSVKAGLFPLHVWLPDAHPAAPSHVSALMSGVVVKTGIYGILRVVGLLPSVSPNAGVVFMLLGGAGALYGIAMAILQRDIKRCLAYSTVENIGIIFLGLGLGLFASRHDQPLLAVLGFAGALLHIWNHTLFKGLMFLGAGSLLHGTGTRDMNQMGGLLKRMPWTGSLLVGGSLAIAALPPFNGLVSEWLLYLGLLKAGLVNGGFGGLVPLLLVGVLGLTGALALVAFTRLAGITLCGEPRSAAASHAHESGPKMIVPMLVLLLACLAIGLRPQWAIGLLAAPLALLVPVGPDMLTTVLEPVAQIGNWGALLVLALAATTLGLLGLLRVRPRSWTTTWGCGFSFPTARMAYTGDGFAELTQSHLLPAALRLVAAGEAVAGFFPRAVKLVQHGLDPVLGRWFLPGFERVADRCVRLRWLQQGRLQVYLLYVFLACAVLMAWSVLAELGWGGG